MRYFNQLYRPYNQWSTV